MPCSNEWTAFVNARQDAEGSATDVQQAADDLAARQAEREAAEAAEAQAEQAFGEAQQVHDNNVAAMDAAYSAYSQCIRGGQQPAPTVRTQR